MDKGLTVLKWVKLAENTPNASKYFGPICLPKPKSLGFSKKKLSLGVCSPCFKWCKKTQKELWKFGFPFQTKLTYYIVGVILWDAISPHFSLSNSLLKLNSDRLSCVWGATRLHSGLKTIMMNYFCFYSSMFSRDIPSVLVKSRFSKYQINLEIYPNICGLLWKPVFE